MDRKEAVLRIKEHMKHHGIGEYPHLKLKEALDMAIAALSQPNEALTLEQLREMNGEPVYCINIDDYSTKEWMIVGKDDCEGRRYIFDFSTYSRNWLAYRRPPEGEEDT